MTLRPAEVSFAEEFTVVAGIRELPDGRVLVTDERENRITLLDPAGGAVRAVSRKGSGPGEYQQVARLFAFGADSTVMQDRFRNGWYFFAGDSVRSSLPWNGGPFAVLTNGGRLIGVDREGRFILQVLTGVPTPGGPPSFIVVRLDRRTRHLDTLTALGRIDIPGTTDGPQRADATPGSRPRRYVMNIIAQDQVAMFPDGWIAIARVAPYRVDWCPPAQRCRTGSPIPFEAPATSTTEKTAYLEWAHEARLWPPTNKLEETTGWPLLMPPFDIQARFMDGTALLTLPDGRLLIERTPTKAQPGRRYDVIDRTGALAGAFTVPPTTRVVGAGAKGIYVTVRDDDDLVRLRRHPW